MHEFSLEAGATSDGGASADLPDRVARDPLWQRIAAFDIDGGHVARPFAARLAEECRWRRSTATAAIEEYRRFLYLAMVAPHPVTPSVAVDLVWHLHLSYTRSYWDRLCDGVLGRPLHHDPTPGGKAAREGYAGQYARTLESYERIFGQKPPPRLWPPAAQRFHAKAQPRLYAPRTHWRMHKNLLRAPLLGAGGLAILSYGGGSGIVFFAGAAACMIAAAMALEALVGSVFGSGEVGVAFGSSGSGDGDGDGDGGGGCGGD